MTNIAIIDLSSPCLQQEHFQPLLEYITTHKIDGLIVTPISDSTIEFCYKYQNLDLTFAAPYPRWLENSMVSKQSIERFEELSENFGCKYFRTYEQANSIPRKFRRVFHERVNEEILSYILQEDEEADIVCLIKSNLQIKAYQESLSQLERKLVFINVITGKIKIYEKD